jgi:carbamoyl-phosphate synthase large subunit
MPARKDLERILIIGSGPIVIGQACEFDYSGTQAVRALKETGYHVILANPNPATVMTTPGLADKVYMEPLKPEYLEQIIRHERPDAILPTMGGQTALNLTLKLYDEGILARYGVEVIGANVDAIRKAEDRGLFKQVALDMGLEVPRSLLTKDSAGAYKILKEVGLPLIIRPSFTLGGQGGSIAYTEEELGELVARALDESPVGEALIEESLIGWKEFELEVMRDKSDNAMVVCSIENIDPMGVHTGDSITVAPVQTLSDKEYQTMRTAALNTLRAIGVDCGGSNVQFAVKPDTGRMVIIEMNPRVSRSSALASKATGFPIARCSAKLAVGFTLDEVVNEITGVTYSCFEPTLDYCVVKVPRFELEKFPYSYDILGTQMKSVGESLAIGRCFVEALNKAIRAAEFGYEGLEGLKENARGKIEQILGSAHPLRVFAIYQRIREQGRSCLPELNRKTAYDPWFLHEMAEFAEFEKGLSAGTFDDATLLAAKRLGMSDKQIARALGKKPAEIEKRRVERKCFPSYHFVDTCAGEFAARTPYFYSSYGEIDEGEPMGKKAVLILASGPNRIGQGLEFDTCCTLTSMAYRALNRKTIIINSNPETVSTDFNVSDRLYIEPLVLESVKDVIRREKVEDVIVQLGGQTALNMAEALAAWGARIVGTPVKSILDAEDRGLFAKLVRRLKLRQPENRIAASKEEVLRCSREIGYPVLLRPSFVLGGRSMFIGFDETELADYLEKRIKVDADNPVLVDKFLEDASEYDLDALADGENVYIAGIMQHIEAAGIHSGDSACVFPPYRTEPRILEEMKAVTALIARDLQVKGFLNIQYAVKDGLLYILEVNPRASRTIPYLSKASGVNLIEAAVRVWEGRSLVAQGLTGAGECKTGWAVKEAVFSFERFRELDPLLGPEMKSTGEVIGTGLSFGEAFAKAQASSGTILPKKGKVFVSVHDLDKEAVLPIVRELAELGFTISATRGTADFFFQHGIFPEVILKVHEGRPNIIDHMRTGRISLLINTPLGRYSQKGDQAIRIEAVKRKIPYTTTISAAQAAVEGIRYLKTEEIEVRAL